MLHLDMHVKDCIAEFLVNGIPIKRLDSNAYGFNSMVAHHQLIDGENTFEILINPGPTPSSARVLTRVENDERHNTQPKAMIQLMKYEVGAFAGDTDSGEILMQLNWEYDKEQHQKLPFPMSTYSRYNLGRHLGKWAWQVCPKINLDTEYSNITTIITQLYNAFITGNSARFVSSLLPYLDDAGRALPAFGTVQLTKDITDDINDNKQLTEGAEEFDANKLDLRLCGNENLVQIINKDWRPTMRIPLGEEYGGDDYEIEMFIGKVNGQWQAVL